MELLFPVVELFRRYRFVALTGAGVSTESGIPDYRGPGTRQRARRPMQYREFMTSASARRRYWARSTVGWPRIAAARPNPGHVALARLEAMGYLTGIITQNVDGLHQAAGSRQVVELHGALAWVRCLACGHRISRAKLQEQLLAMNPRFLIRHGAMAPDGDAEVAEGLVRDFHVPDCPMCGGVLKPDVVFFGENVPPSRVEAAWALYEAAEALLVCGSSLTVFSGYRFALRAAQEGRPLVIMNLGPTRADALATLRLPLKTGTGLPRLVEALSVQYVGRVA